MKPSLLKRIVVAATVVGVLAGGAGQAGAHGISVVRPGESIQAAVDAASPGATILVKRGTYAENVAITTDGITLRGLGATLVPPVQAAPNACSQGGPATDGICAVGQLDTSNPNGPPVVTDPVSDVTVSGFTVRGFPGSGIFFLGAENPVASWNRTEDDGAYGIARFTSTGGKLIANKASGSAEAGIYVGDSPNADALLAGNDASDNQLGFFLRDAANGRLVGNRSHGNCVGALVTDTGPNVAGRWRFFGNRISGNDKFCPPNAEEGSPALSGIGVMIANASDNTLIGNVIRNNTASGDVPIKGGVVVLDFGTPGANPPSGNVVKGNLIVGNDPDIFWDGSGQGNVFRRNLCRTSVPDGLCH